MAPKPKRAALYFRVSTTNRTTKNPNVFEQDPSVRCARWQSSEAGR